MVRLATGLIAGAIVLLVTAGPPAAAKEADAQRKQKRPICISGIYPHLAALSDARSECGIGAVVPWAGSLWFITYPAHYGDGKLYQVTEGLELRRRPESIGGTHAGRLIHRESNQLVIGPYFIDARSRIKSTKLRARITAVMRHLTDPKNKVYVFDMEGGFFEVDVRTMEFKRLFRVQQRGVTGKHGKGGYTGQGVVVIANNGGGGGLAEWDGQSEKWRLIEHKKFCEVTGPGGIRGAPADRDADIPLWSTGWDHRSVILKVRRRGTWSTYRLPKSSYTHDPDHGWYTEWPRIREIEPGRILLDFHAMFFDFPGDFQPGRTAGLRPIARHLRMVPDFCNWKGRIVFGSDDTSVMGHKLGGQPQSNLWFVKPADLLKLGKPAGWGGPWVNDPAEPGKPSPPFLIDGFDHRMVYLAHDAAEEVQFTLEIDAKGDGTWAKHASLAVPARGWRYHVFPADLRACWARVKVSKSCKATAYFHYGPSPGPGDAKAKAADAVFAALPAVGEAAPRTDGVLLPHAGRLWLLAKSVDERGRAGDAGLFEVDKDMKIRRRPELPANAYTDRVKALLAERAPKKEPFAKLSGGYALGWDDASVILQARGRRFRLPKADARYDRVPAAGRRQIREVVTERYLMNCHGLFYELPRQTAAGIRPVATHKRIINDFCTWRGLLVICGARASAKPDGHYFASDDGQVGLWFGAVDDLWKFGKPTGAGGPWRQTAVRAGQPSDAYLMTGFDKKTLELSHDAKEDRAFTIEVDFLGPAGTGKGAGSAWRAYRVVKVPPGETVRHVFPAGFSAHWVRLTADKDCKATAWFLYE